MKGNITEEELHHNRKRIGQLLREAREKKGLTQEELSERMGITRPSISKIEDGKWSFSIDMITLFCHHLGLEIELKGTR